MAGLIWSPIVAFLSNMANQIDHIKLIGNNYLWQLCPTGQIQSINECHFIIELISAWFRQAYYTIRLSNWEGNSCLITYLQYYSNHLIYLILNTSYIISGYLASYFVVAGIIMPCDSTTDDNGALLLPYPNSNRNPTIDHYWHTYQARATLHMTGRITMVIWQLWSWCRSQEMIKHLLGSFLILDDVDDDVGIRHSIYFDMFIL